MKKKILDFFVVSLNGMAYGLFATLIIGTIFQTLGQGAYALGLDFVYDVIGDGIRGISYILQVLTGAGIGIGIALALKLDTLKTIVLGVVGEIASYFSLSTKFITLSSHPTSGSFKIGDPLTVYLVCISVALLLNLILRKKTPVDIILIPLLGVSIGLVLALGIRYPSIYITYAVQWLVNVSTNSIPLVSGIVVAVAMGMALTAPISSAAIAAMIFMLPEGISVESALTMNEYRGLVIASGAAIVGCSCQMVGFMIQSRKDNNIGMLVSIGIGTSMLQFKNILKKPIIWLPTIIASAILGPLVTCIFNLYCMGSSAGMGTAGLVGQIGTFASMGFSIKSLLLVLGFEIILPLILVFGFDLLFRKFKLYSDGDLKI